VPAGRRPSFDETVPAIPASVPRIRAALAAHLRAAGVPRSVVDMVKVAVSEAVSNVVVHAYIGRDRPGPVHVTAYVSDDTVHVSVRDEGLGTAPPRKSPGAGLGIPLIAEVATSMRMTQSPGDGTDVRMRFDA
jgi:anti-sigma regulatory factor (Ser/Thr protein kinase)